MGVYDVLRRAQRRHQDLEAFFTSYFQHEAGERQIQRHSLGLAQNLGGSGATAVVTILGAAQ